jgi:hypothetical protein
VAHGCFITTNKQKQHGLSKKAARGKALGITRRLSIIDCNGVHVALDRRSGIDRRQSPADLEDLLILFSQLPSPDPAKKQ